MRHSLNCHLIYGQHIVRGSKKPRLKSKLYIFNSFGMLGEYNGTESELWVLMLVEVSTLSSQS